MNSLSSVAAPPGWYTESSGYNGPWTNWCGAIFAGDYSEHGAWVIWGGGHGGYSGTELYIFDLTTQLWSRLNDPIPYDFLRDTSADWCDVLYGGQYVPPPSHTYNIPVYISAAQGGGPKGSFCMPYNVYGGGPGEGAGTVGYRPHACDLATGVWSRFGTNDVQVSGGSGSLNGCFVDTNNNILWGMVMTEASSAYKLDLMLTPRVPVLQGFVYSPSQYASYCFVPEKNMMVAAWIYEDGTGRIKLRTYDLTPGRPVGVDVTLAAPVSSERGGAGISIDYCPDTNKFYLYEGFGSNTLYVATPPASGDWINGTWSIGTETMGGEAAANVLTVASGALGAHPFSKWRYHRGLKCFMWSQGTVVRASPDGTSRDGAFQLYRPLGT
jgi:hypothetical protein